MFHHGRAGHSSMHPRRRVEHESIPGPCRVRSPRSSPASIAAGLPGLSRAARVERGACGCSRHPEAMGSTGRDVLSRKGGWARPRPTDSPRFDSSRSHRAAAAPQRRNGLRRIPGVDPGDAHVGIGGCRSLGAGRLPQSAQRRTIPTDSSGPGVTRGLRPLFTFARRQANPRDIRSRWWSWLFSPGSPPSSPRGRTAQLGRQGQHSLFRPWSGRTGFMWRRAPTDHQCWCDGDGAGEAALGRSAPGGPPIAETTSPTSGWSHETPSASVLGHTSRPTRSRNCRVSAHGAGPDWSIVQG